MTQQARRIVIIGGGIAGLCAAVYARKAGYEVILLERHESPGGLATRWQRGDYVFETCLHWLLGSDPEGALHDEWREVCDIDSLKFLYHEEFVRVESQDGKALHVFSDVDWLEAELLTIAPEDAEEIGNFTRAIRHLIDLPIPDPSAGWPERGLAMLRMLPEMPLLWRLSHVSAEDYGKRFTNPLVRRFFGEGGSARMSVLALIFSLAWMSARNAGYPIGGSRAVVDLVADRFASLGGTLRCGALVDRILVEDDAAVGVRLAGGETIAADWVISAADGHATVYDLLGGAYTDESVDQVFETFETFPSYLQVSLGVARDLSAEPGYLTIVLDAPLVLDPATSLEQLSFRLFHYDPTCAPAGKTAVTCFLPTQNFAYWAGLREKDDEQYRAEKERVAQAVIAILDRRVPGVASAIEVTDVSTPATVMRLTGNWKGSMEGWLMTPETGFGGLPMTLPGLHRLVRAGQWVQPGGGLPGGLMTGRAAVQAICREDRVPFPA